MRHRAWIVAFFLLGIGTGLGLWQLLESAPPCPDPQPPPAVSHPVDALPIINDFGSASSLPKELPDETFFRMIDQFSEPDGAFMYENYVSNERTFQDPIPALLKTQKPGGVYLGVGPEQNFTYISAIRPAMAFIIDIRRQNMLELLMYKALFRLAANRAEFVGLLFSRHAPAYLDQNSDAEEIFRAFAAIRPDPKFYESNMKRIAAHLQLSPDDEKTVEGVYQVFYSVGPDLNYASVSPYAPTGPSYASLMTRTDVEGRSWSYLATEENFRFVKEMQRRNLIVPLVGDFAGPKAIRTVAKFMEDHQAKMSAFYLSNVEMYILGSPSWKSFCGNVAALPMDESSMFIRFLLGAYARAASKNGLGPPNLSVIGPMIDVLTGMKKGYPPSYYDLIRASR